MNSTLLFMGFAVCAELQCAGQTAKFLVAGGLLGRTYGFCEATTAKSSVPVSGSRCAKDRSPFGGAAGLADAIEAKPKDAYVLLTGNNFEQDFRVPADGSFQRFWGEIGRMHPDVVALGTDDFLRAALPACPEGTCGKDSVNARVAFLAGTRLPFLSSNAALRSYRPGLNRVRDHGFAISIPDDESAPWTTSKIRVQFPSGYTTGIAYELAHATNRTAGTLTPSNGSASIDIQPVPGATYTLTLGPSGAAASFHFQFDRALTPKSNLNGPEELRDLPVSLLTAHGPGLLVASLANPGLKDMLDNSFWTEKATGAMISLTFYSPKDTLQAIVTRMKNFDGLSVLLSDLPDDANLQLLVATTAWKVVSFNSDSHLLGCADGATGCIKNPDEPYSLGSYAIIDRQDDRTQIWLRPEWVGETLMTLTVKRTGPSQWVRSRVELEDVKGYAQSTAEPTVLLATGREKRDLVAPPPPMYMQSAQPAKRIWWQKREDVAVMLMDSVRDHLNTELAIADQRMIDNDSVKEFAREAQGGKISGIAPRDLMDMIWRQDLYTRAFLTGDELAKLLGKLAGATPDDDEGGYCVRGLSEGGFTGACAIPRSIDTAKLLVNGRYFDKQMAYSVAIPQSLGNAQNLTYSRRNPANVFQAMNDYLRRQDQEQANNGAPVQQQASAPNALESRWLRMFFIPPAAIEVGGQNFHVPQQNGKPDASGFAAIPLVGEKAQHTFKFNLLGEIHVVPLDFHAISLDLLTKENLNRLDTYPITATGVKQIAYSPDLWTSGSVLRSRAVTSGVSKSYAALTTKLTRGKLKPSIRLEPFVGYYVDTSIFHYQATYVSTTLNDSSGNGLEFEQNDRKPAFAYLGAGLGLSDIKLNKVLTLKGSSYRKDTGMNYAAPKGVSIGDAFFNMDQVRRSGIQKLVDSRTVAPSSPTVNYVYAVQRQSRQVLGTSLEFAVGADAKKRSITLDFKGNRWEAGPGGYTPLDPLWTTEVTIKTSVPVFAGISLGPYYRRLTIKAYGSPGTFTSQRYGFTLTLPLIGKSGAGRIFY